MTGNSAGANHLAELDAHLETHLTELHRHAQRVRDELAAEVDALQARTASGAPPPRFAGPLRDDDHSSSI